MVGTLFALIADTATHTYLKDGVHLEGTMYSCSSMGIKVGGGIGSALCGWLLYLGGYNGLAATQTVGAINMINFMYLGVPLIGGAISLIIVSALNVDKANKKLLAASAQAGGTVTNSI